VSEQATIQLGIGFMNKVNESCVPAQCSVTVE